MISKAKCKHFYYTTTLNFVRQLSQGLNLEIISQSRCFIAKLILSKYWTG